MKLTNRSEYALLALSTLARSENRALLSADEICAICRVPKRFLQQILFSLKRGGFIHTVKGQEGGYQLARPPDEIVLADVIRHLEGPLAATASVSKNFYHPTPIEQEAGLVTLFAKIRDEVAKILESTTLDDVSRPSTSTKSVGKRSKRKM